MSENKSSGLVKAVLVLALVAIAGWIAWAITHRAFPPPQVPPVTENLISPAIDIDVYLDGTGSILGFLKDPSPADAAHLPPNYFHTFLDHLATSLDGAIGAKNGKAADWGGSTTVCYQQFGGFSAIPNESSLPYERCRPRPINSTSGLQYEYRPLARDGLRNLADQPDNEFQAQHTFIEEPVKDVPKKVNAASLKIIITDLYESGHATTLGQTSGGVEDFGSPLAETYLSDETHAIAIFTVRNPFSGSVDDLPSAGKMKLTKPADTMPFYVIIAGQPADVRHAARIVAQTRGIKEAISDGNAMEMYFSKAPAPASTETPVVEGPDPRAKTLEWKTVSALQAEHYQGIETAEFPKPLARSKPAETQLKPTATMVTFNKKNKVRVSWQPVPTETNIGQVDTLGTDWYTTEVHAEVTVDKQGTTQEDPKAVAAVTNNCAGHAMPCVTIDSSLLESKKTYLFHFDIVTKDRKDAPSQSVLDPKAELMKPWNLELNEAVAMVHVGKDAQFEPVPKLARKVPGDHPGRTPQLSQFFSELQEKMLNTPVRISRYYLYVRTK